MQQFFYILLLTVFSLCGMTATASTIADSDTATQTVNSNDIRFRQLFIQAIIKRNSDNYLSYFHLLRRCHELKPNAPEVNRELARMYYVFRKDSLWQYHLRKAIDAAPNDKENLEAAAQLMLHAGKTDEAVKLYEQLSALKPSNVFYLSQLISIYEDKRDYPNILRILDRITTIDGPSERITLYKMNLYNNMGDTDGAYKELESLTDSNPYDMSMQVMKGNWLMSHNRKEEALQTYLHVIEEDPQNANCQMALMDYYRDAGDTIKADDMLSKMLMNPDTDPSIKRVQLIKLASESINNGGSDSARVFSLFQPTLKNPEKIPDVAEIWVEYLRGINQPDSIVTHELEKALELQPDNVNLRLSLIIKLWNDTIDERTIEECKRATEYIPDNPVLYYYLGMAQSICEKYPDACASLRKGTTYIAKDTPEHISSGLYSMLGDVLQRVNDFNGAREAYEESLKIDPDQPTTLNNYAYFLSVRGTDLKKAEKMSYLSITQEANNSTFLDTYAWILYQQQRYDEARIYIDRALENDTTEHGPNGEILDHAGDIYFNLGHIDQAVGFWEKALPLLEDEAPVIRKKIKKRKIVRK